MKLLFVVLAIMLSGCASLRDSSSPYGGEIPPNRLYWPNQVDRVVAPSGSFYIIKGKSK